MNSKQSLLSLPISVFFKKTIIGTKNHRKNGGKIDVFKDFNPNPKIAITPKVLDLSTPNIRQTYLYYVYSHLSNKRGAHAYLF